MPTNVDGADHGTQGAGQDQPLRVAVPETLAHRVNPQVIDELQRAINQRRRQRATNIGLWHHYLEVYVAHLEAIDDERTGENKDGEDGSDQAAA